VLDLRILRNEFNSDLRRNRPTVDIHGEIANLLSVPPRQEDGLVLREFLGAFRTLKRGSREALLLVHLDGWSHRRIADRSGIAVGTVKSRISRSRTKLARLLNPPAFPPVSPADLASSPGGPQ
jgi:RNA polymerase sigma-70 factor (ECF subfamily)